jgi:CheY-like chemotaxis protein
VQADNGGHPIVMRILVADDDQDTLVSFSMLLQVAGYEVRSAADGQDAVDVAAAFRPAAALLDIWMPDLNGYEAAARIRALLPNVLLVAITGVPDRAGGSGYKAAGFDYYLLKPVSLAQIREVLNSRYH